MKKNRRNFLKRLSFYFILLNFSFFDNSKKKLSSLIRLKSKKYTWIVNTKVI